MQPSKRVASTARDSLAAQALELFERESGPLHPDVANVLNCLAIVHTQQADYRKAEAAPTLPSKSCVMYGRRLTVPTSIGSTDSH